MTKLPFPRFALWTFLAMAQASVAAPQLSERFTLNGVFAMPESAVIDEAGEYIYVSNVNNYAKDGNGFISRLRVDGSDLNLRWLEGLDSPTGLAIRDDILYLADFDQLVSVDLRDARILNRYPSPDDNPALNDVAIAEHGDVYVSGSGSRSIYRLEQGRLSVWLQDDELLAFANGLYAAGEFLLHGGQRWTVFDLGSKQATPLLSSVNDELADIDGIATDGCGGYLVTTVESDSLWWVDEAGRVAAAAIGAIGGIDLFRRDSLLAVPRVGNSLSLYELSGSC